MYLLTLLFTLIIAMVHSDAVFPIKTSQVDVRHSGADFSYSIQENHGIATISRDPNTIIEFVAPSLIKSDNLNGKPSVNADVKEPKDIPWNLKGIFDDNAGIRSNSQRKKPLNFKANGKKANGKVKFSQPSKFDRENNDEKVKFFAQSYLEPSNHQHYYYPTAKPSAIMLHFI